MNVLRLRLAVRFRAAADGVYYGARSLGKATVNAPRALYERALRLSGVLAGCGCYLNDASLCRGLPRLPVSPGLFWARCGCPCHAEIERIQREAAADASAANTTPSPEPDPR